MGPTASGKSALALRVAERLGGEIISADSRQLYRGMDIATAKPSAAERARVPHHLIDVADPGERYDLFRFQRDARAALAAIRARGRVALVAGGTGLYVRALLDGLDLAALPHDAEVRARLESEAPVVLYERLRRIDPEAASRVDPRNLRRVVRYLEVATIAGGAVPRRRDATVPALRIGLRPPREVLAGAIERRVRDMLAAGVLDETRVLVARGVDPRLPSMSAHGYVHWAAHLRGQIDLETAVARTTRDVRAYSRRQMTWFRRDGAIRWYDPTTVDPLDEILRAAA
ncbi:MAG TPA: tRNA (adenosine(37)-N6)-dimethylallyltransferase MiaA [Candidatus Limnocylindria bacterium]|nr:tRNA (adenosine(37)-N6)-dimethylallyltransferase MiaA [Candidatus Limnocylindria bacterium]